MTTIELPVDFEAIVECPRCGDVASIMVSMHGRLVADDDGSGSLGIRTDAKKVGHVCAQARLDQVPGFDSVTIETEDRSVTVDAAAVRRLRAVARDAE